MELRQQFYYVGETMAVRVSISNDGPMEVANPVKSPLFGSFVIADQQGKKMAPQAKPQECVGPVLVTARRRTV